MARSVMLPDMIGRHPLMLHVYELVHRVARAKVPVLIVGETGTGKELIARAIHALGNRSGPLVDVNCAAIPESLFEAELFGWERGAFTGAVRSTAGLIENANGGSLFLDEVCSLPLSAQAKLLRAVEHKDSRRVGGRAACRSDFRLITAASQAPEQLVAENRMRADFAFRIGSVVIEVPPLRSRRSDIPILAEAFLAESTNHSREFSDCALGWLRDQVWTGNVRELKALVDRVTLLTDDDTLTRDSLIPLVADAGIGDSPEDLRALLQSLDWDMSATARKLCMSRSTLYERVRGYGLRRPAGRRNNGDEPAARLEEASGIV